MTKANQAHNLSGITYQGNGDHSTKRVAVVVSKWNEKVTGALAEGAVAVLRTAGISEYNILRIDVPGSFELPTAAQFVIEKNKEKFSLDGVICLGCVIQGETRHFDFINNAVSSGIMDVALKYNLPVIFGVLTPDTDAQAEARAGGELGNKGEEAAVALLEMLDLKN